MPAILTLHATSRTSACSWDSLLTDQASETALRCALMQPREPFEEKVQLYRNGASSKVKDRSKESWSRSSLRCRRPGGGTTARDTSRCASTVCEAQSILACLSMGELRKASMSGCLKQGGSPEARPCTKTRNAAQIFRPFRCIGAKPPTELVSGE